MSDLSEALRRAAAKPITHPSLAELQAELSRRHRRRRVGWVMVSAIVVVGIGGAAMLRPLPDSGRVVRAAGDGHSSETTVQAPGAHVGDGFCEPQLTNAGFRITPPAAGAAPAQTKAAALELARSLPGTGTGSYDGYFASVRNPIALKVNPGAADTPRPTWVVEASDVIPPTRSTDVHLRGGAANVDRPGPYRMVVFVDDATLTSVGIFGDCEPVRGPTEPAAGTQPGRLDGSAVVRLDGVGPVRVGMTIDEARRVAGDGGNSTTPPSCPSLVYSVGGSLVLLTASGGEQVDAVSVSGGDLKTDAGVGIGSTVEDLGRAYGTLNIHARVASVNGSPTTPASRYIYQPADPALSAYAIAFDVEGGIVRSLRSGLRTRVLADQTC